MVFPVAPEVLHRVEFRRVSGQALQFEPGPLAGDPVLDQAAAVRGQAVPDDQQPAREMAHVNAELNCHFFADADVPRLTNSLFLAPDTIAGCVGSYAVPPPDDFAESRAGAAVFSGAC